MVTLPKEKGVHEHPRLCRVGEVLSPLDTRFCVWNMEALIYGIRDASSSSKSSWVSYVIIAKLSEQIGLASHSWLGAPISFTVW